MFQETNDENNISGVQVNSLHSQSGFLDELSHKAKYCLFKLI